MRKVFTGIIIAFSFVLMISCTVYNVMFGIGTAKDVDYPEVYIVSPHNTDCVAGTFNVKGYATDRGGLAGIVLEYSDRNGLKQIVDYPTTSDFDIPLNLYAQNVDSGDFKLSVTAVDMVMHKTTVFLNITVDKETPAITLFTPVEDGYGSFRDTLVGNVTFSGVVSDNYAIKSSSPNNLLKIYELDDETNVIFRQNISGSPFQISGFDTMDESHIAGDYVMCLSFEDINGNIGKKILNLSTAKGDTTTFLTVDAPKHNGIFTDALTIAGNVRNDFLAVKSVEYKITLHNQSDPVNYKASGSLPIGVAGAFSTILSLKNILSNTGSHFFDLRLFAVAEDETVSDTKVIPFEFNKDLADYEFIDSSEGSIIPGLTPLMSSYINGAFDIQFASRSTLYDILYSIVQNGITLVDFTSLNNTKQTVGTVSKYGVHIIPDDIGLQNGSFNILAKASMTETGDYRPVSRVVNYDTIPPQLIITSPEIVSGINGALTIAGTANDNFGLKNVMIKENDYADNQYKEITGSLALWSYVAARDDSTDDITIEEKYGISEDETKDISFTVKAVDYAGNTSLADITVTVAPSADKPVITILNPPADDMRSSGSLTVSAVIVDDDYPLRNLSAKMAIYKYEQGLDSPSDYIDKKEEIDSKEFEISVGSGDLNLTNIIEIENGKYEDLSKYVILLTGSGWKKRKADPVMRTFIVDKSAPMVIIDDYDESDLKYFTDSIRFAGYVLYKQNSVLVDDAPLILQYPGVSGTASVARIALGDMSFASVGGISYKKQSFDITINADGTNTGFVSGGEPTIVWSDDKWGNSNKLFTFRATSTTAVQGYKTCRVYLDNHKPAAAIIAPENNCLFREPSTQSFTLQFTVDDKPTDGDEYPLNMSNVLIEYRFADESDWHTLLDYGQGNKAVSLNGIVSYRVDFNKIIDDGVGHLLRLTVKDLAGNTSIPQILTFNKNTKPPVVETFRIKNANMTNYYKGNITFQIEASDSYGAADDGIKSLTLYIDGKAAAVRNVLPDGIIDVTVDSTEYPDGLHIFAVKVVDNSDIAVTNKTYGIDDIALTIDNTKPTLNTCQLLSMGLSVGEETAVDEWSVYLGLQLSAEDNLSLYAMSPTVRIGTVSEGEDILAETSLIAMMNGVTTYTAKYTNWIDLYEMLGDAYGSTDKIYVTVKVTDVAGNVEKAVRHFDKADLPSIAFDKDEMFPYPCITSMNVKGTYNSESIGKVWIKVGTSDWSDTTCDDGTGVWSHNFAKEDCFANSGIYTFHVRALTKDKKVQVITLRKFIVDVQEPVITLDSVQALSSETGRVSGKKLSGKIKISGTYSDDLADYLADVSGACLQLSVGNVVKDITNVTRNYSGTSWNWYYIWDTQDIADGFLSKVTGKNIKLVCSCSDIAGTGSSTSKDGCSVVPYITNVAGTDGSVYPVRVHRNNKWQIPADNQKYSVSVGTTVEVSGFNLKQGSTQPTVTRGETNVGLISSGVNSIRFTVGETWQSDFINISVNETAADNTVYLNVWAFSCMDREGYNDTLDAEGYDAELLSTEITLNGKTTNPVFVTFARNHKIPNEYTGADYCAFSFWEGSANPAADFALKMDGGTHVVDPVFYTAFARVSDNKFMTMFTYDEYDSPYDEVYTQFGLIKKDGSRNAFYDVNGGVQSSDCIKSARIVYNKKNSRYYIACYDDESRKISPVPKVYFASTGATSSGISDASVELGSGSNYNCSGYYDLDSVTFDGGSSYCPVLVFCDNDKIYIRNANEPDSANLTGDINLIQKNVKYIKTAPISAGNGVHLSYKDENNNLVYRRCEYTGTWAFSENIKLEEAETEIGGMFEGITGAYTDIDVSAAAKTKGGVTYEADSPHISYINSSKLNTVSALRYARSSTAAPTKAKWEYMIVPSPVAVGSGNTIIKTDVSGNPVIVYKGNNRLYIGRLLD